MADGLEMRTRFSWGKLEEGDSIEEFWPGREGSISPLLGKDVDLINVTNDRDKWWVVVNTLINFRILQRSETFLH